jgi:hypothetical protein
MRPREFGQFGHDRLSFCREEIMLVTILTDFKMTVLLHSALGGSAGAALVLSSLLRRLPIDSVLRRRLATSWLAHNFRHDWPELDRSLVQRRAKRAEQEDAT